MRAVACLVLLAGCSESLSSLPIDLSGEKVVVASFTSKGAPSTALLVRQGDEPLELASDPGTPVFAWLLEPGDFAKADGSTVTFADLGALRVRPAELEPAGPGPCGRCLFQAAKAPQLVNPGEGCPPPSFAEGAAWLNAEDGLTCTAGAQGTLCPPGDEAARAALEEARLATRVDWPGNCACGVEPAWPKLDHLDIRPIEPSEAPAAMVAMAQGPSGRVAGVSRFGSFLHDPATGLTTTQSFEVDENVTQLLALETGDFVMVTEDFSLGHDRHYSFQLLASNGDRLDPPSPLGFDTPLSIAHAERLGGDATRPLYLGGELLAAGGLSPAMLACNDAASSCESVRLSQCNTAGSEWAISDMGMLESGAGVAIGGHMFYLKAANPPPMMNPLPGDLWSCLDRPETIPWRGGAGEPVRPTEWRALGELGDRVFLCAETQPDPCGPSYAIVVSATVTPSVGEAPSPRWEVIHRAPDGVGCRAFIKVPGRPIARLLLSGQRILDFDARGEVLGETSLGSAYGPVPGFDHVQQDRPGWLMAWGSENQAFVATGTGAFAKMYGGEALSGANFGLLLALPDGDFIAFGHPAGPARVSVRPNPSFPETSLDPLEDPEQAFLRGDWLRAAVLDTFASIERRQRIWVTGTRARKPLVEWFEIEDTTIVAHEVIALPDDLGDRSIYGVAQIGPGQLVVLVDDSILLRIDGARVREIEVDWDDPMTPEEETRPARGANACTHSVPRVHVWRAIAGGQGVAWVGGTDGVVMRVVGLRAERFTIPAGPGAEIAHIDARCADDVRFAAFGRATRDDTNARLLLFRTGPAEPTMSGAEVDPRGIELQRVGAMQLEALTFVPISWARPRALLRDDTAGRADDEELPFSVVLENGYVQRMFANERPGYLRAPFWPWAVAQSPKGWVLFGTGEARLALGVPR